MLNVVDLSVWYTDVFSDEMIGDSGFSMFEKLR